MANFVMCVDADAERRRRFIEAASARLPLFPGMRSGAAASGDFAAAWAVSPRAPLTHVSDVHGASIVLGEMIVESGERLKAEALRALWSEGAVAEAVADFDGFFAACTYVTGQRLLVGADLLGLFPVYWYESGGVLLIGSSPEAFSCHPVFRAAFDPAGLVGILLTNGLFNGTTLFAGVHRLAPGHVLHWEPGASAREVRRHRISYLDRYGDLSFSNHLDIIDEAMRAAVARHAPAGRTYTLMLSGGLDSRTIGGYLRQAGRDVVALSLGKRGDIELRCAATAARALGMRQHVREVSPTSQAEARRLHTTWEHSAAGGSTMMQWSVRELLGDFPPAVVTGRGLDWVIAGHAPTTPGLSFETFFPYQNRWGLTPELLRTLLRRDVFGDTVPEVMDRMRATYTGYSDVESQRSWGFSLHHRQRFHIGSDAWRVSFASWPILPGSDKALVDLGAGLPPSTVADRRAQLDLLRTRFPDLAALPLDRNSWDTTPLLPNLGWLLAERLRRPVHRLREALDRRGWGVSERRRYYRVFDINGAGWMAARREAELCRDLAHGFFDKQALDELLPRPDVPLRSGDGIADVAGVKSVISFMLWARDHLK